MKRSLSLLSLLLSLPCAAFAVADTSFPGAHWQVKPPGDLRLDGDRLHAVALALGGRGCIIKDGYVVQAWGDLAEKGDWLSSAKPVLSTLLLFAIQEGQVKSVDTPIAEFGWELRPKDRAITFRHLANMTSGYARPEQPGEAWAYNDFAIQLYQKTLFDRVFKDNPDAVANAPTRFGALGLEDGLSFTADKRRLKASPRDFARIAWLWLNRGQWHDRALLPRRYFDELMRPQTSRDLPVSRTAQTDDYLGIGTFGGGSEHFTRDGAGIYGCNWWFNDTGRDHLNQRTWPDAPADTVMSIGAGGNCSVLLPGLNMVVVGAQGDWGRLEAGAADSVLNQRLKLIALAGTPISQATPQVARSSPPPATTDPSNGVAIDGELQQWHRVTLTLHGPQTDEQAAPNPFRDYRLNVTFTCGEQKIVVPGFYAADGNAAESSAAAGNAWRVHFSPPLVGRWRWTASFRHASDIATLDDPAAGQPIAFDGASGELEIAPSDKTGRDFRRHGMLNYVGQRYLKFAGSGEWFLKGGADSPENFLAYYEFDQTKPTHRYGAHAIDTRASDPTWQGGKGQNICGALNYLADSGVNSVYMLTLNVKGDGKDVWPWTSDTERLRYDVSKLDQWEIVFAHMDRLGMMQHFVLQEQENDQLLDGGELGVERRIYFRELIARFGHHPAITWNLGEENTNTLAQRQAFARYFHEHDPYQHPVVVHTYPRQIETVYSELLGFGELDGASLQTNKTHEQTRQWIERSAAAGRPWFVSLDEIGPADTGVKPDRDDFNHDEVRQDHLWGHLLAGGAGVEWLFGYKYAHHDVNLEDFRSRDQMWRQTRHAVNFCQQHLPFSQMQSADELAQPAGTFCLARPGAIYAVQRRGREHDVKLWLPQASFSIKWFNPRRGGQLQDGSVKMIQGDQVAPLGQHMALGNPPRELDRDWIAVVQLVGDPPKVIVPPRAEATSKLHQIDAQTPDGLKDLLKHSAEPLPLVSAHRGGPQPGFPENCLATFENTLKHTYALLEVDPRYTQDGAIVLHHDPSLERTTTGKGLLAERTLAEVKALRLKDTAGNVTEYSVPTLDEALEWARGKAVLVLDQKDVPVAARVKKIEEHKAEAFAMLIVYSFAEAKASYALNPNIMLEVMVPSHAKVAEFDQTGVPWRNVIAFVGHVPPEDKTLYDAIHSRGANCMIGTSRNLDRRVITGQTPDIKQLEPDYRAFLSRGADVIETDIPTRLGPLLTGGMPPAGTRAKYFQKR